LQNKGSNEQSALNAYLIGHFLTAATETIVNVGNFGEI